LKTKSAKKLSLLSLLLGDVSRVSGIDYEEKEVNEETSSTHQANYALYEYLRAHANFLELYGT
jgi:hypothetical protein